VGWLTHRRGKIDRLESLNEYWLETDARLRTEFNITGLQRDQMERVKRKSEMKEVFQRAGVPVARGRVCRAEAETRAFVDEVGFPVIAKPDVGVGAAKTYRIDDAAALAGYLSDRPTVDYILEEFLSGELISYDGLVDRDGRVIFDASITYGMSVLDAVSGGDMAYWLDRAIPDDLVAIGRRVATAFEVRERPFHFEFFRLPDGALVALEVNMRQPGGLTVDMWNYANDADFYRAWAQVVVHGSAEIANERAPRRAVGRTQAGANVRPVARRGHGPLRRPGHAPRTGTGHLRGGHRQRGLHPQITRSRAAPGGGPRDPGADLTPTVRRG
jgi:biotin carboxylase